LATAATEAEREAHLRAEKPISRLQTIIKWHHNREEKKKNLPTNRKTIELQTKSLIFLSLGQQNTVGKKAATTTTTLPWTLTLTFT